MSIYIEDLESIVLQYNYIPRIFRPNEKFKLYHKYYVPEFKGIIKVVNIEVIDDIEYYFFKYDNLKLDACISYPIEYEGVYELLHNYDRLEDKDIINSEISYTGAEIRYWFIMHNYKDYKKYKPLYPYLKCTGKYSMTDNRKYYINYKNRQFEVIKDCTYL